MNITKTLYVADRIKWRIWLEKNYDREPEIWLVYYKKSSGKPGIPYNDAVEEALCFGWIDSTVKGIDADKYAQRFSPRNPKSQWSQTNKERVRRLINEGKMTPAGLRVFQNNSKSDIGVAPDIVKALKKDKQTWENFQNFPESYKRIRIGWIEMARKRPGEFKKRLNYFLKMTEKNKKFGMVNEVFSL